MLFHNYHFGIGHQRYIWLMLCETKYAWERGFYSQASALKSLVEPNKGHRDIGSYWRRHRSCSFQPPLHEAANLNSTFIFDKHGTTPISFKKLEQNNIYLFFCMHKTALRKNATFSMVNLLNYGIWYQFSQVTVSFNQTLFVEEIESW